jgi:tRNA(Ile2) C34 agmatinyltransferase TiaS
MNDLSTMAPVCECGRTKSLQSVGKGRKKQWKCPSCQYHKNIEKRKRLFSKWVFANHELHKNKRRQYETSIAGLTTRLWNNLNQRTINGKTPRLSRNTESYLKKGIELRITRDELNQFVKDNWDTIQTLRSEGKTPSIDRIGPSIHYELGNIQFISLTDNCVKANKARTK